MPSTVDVSAADFVTVLQINRPENNFFDAQLITELADLTAQLEGDPSCRAIVLASRGKTFCAGADFGNSRSAPNSNPAGPAELYEQAARLFDGTVPIVAAVQGAAVGGGLGLACVADFRVASASSRFTANFARLGFHPGFGLSATLPRIIGQQSAQLLFYTGRRIDGVAAHDLGLVDVLVEPGQELAGAIALAGEIAQSAPLAVRSVRQTLRGALAAEVRAVLVRELAEQAAHFQTQDFAEGIRASSAREQPRFAGR